MSAPLPRPRRWPTGRWLIRLFALLLLGLLLSLVLLWQYQERLLATACDQAGRLTHGQWVCHQASGQLDQEIRIARLEYHAPNLDITLQDLRAQAAIGWLLFGRAQFKSLSVAQLEIRQGASRPGPVHWPRSFALPLPVEAQVLHLGRLHYVHPGQAFELTGLSARAQLQVDHWIFSQLQGKHLGLQLDGSASLSPHYPFRLDSRLYAQGAIAQHPLVAKLALQGALAEQLHLDADGRYAGQAAHLTAQLHLTTGPTVRHFTADAAHWDFRPLFQHFPEMPLQLTLAGRQTAEGWQGSLEARNLAPGRLDQHRIPAQTGQTNWHWHATQQRLTLTELALRLPGSGRLNGQLQYAGRLSISARAQQVSAADFWRGLPTAPIDGPFTLATADYHRYAVNLDWKNRQHDALKARFAISADQLALEQGLIRHGPSQLALQGSLNFHGAQTFAVQTAFQRLDPSRFGPYPAAQLDGTAQLSGALAAGHAQRFELNLAPASQFGQRSLAGKARGQFWLRPRLQLDAAQFHWGGLSLTAQGHWGRTEDRLQFLAQSRGIIPEMVGLAGNLEFQGELSGGLAKPWLTGQLTARQLASPWGTLASLDGRVEMPLTAVAPGQLPRSLKLTLEASDFTDQTRHIGRLDVLAASDGDGRLELSGEAFDLQQNAGHLSELQLQLQGTLAAHQLQLTAHAPEGRWQFAADGQWAPGAKQWRGQIAKADGSGAYPFHLLHPMQASFSPDALQLEQGLFQLGQAQLMLQQLRYRNGEWQSQGSLQQLQLNQLLQWLNKPALPSTLTFGGNWDLALNNTLNGHLHLEREAGDMATTALENLDLDEGQADIVLRDNALQAHLKIINQRIGFINAELTTELARQEGRWGLWGTTPVNGHLQLDIPNLEFMSTWLNAPSLSFAGNLQGQLRLTGTVASPDLTGHLSGRDLALRSALEGLDWKQGYLDAHLTGDQMVIEQLGWQGGDGQVSGHGRLALPGGDPDASLSLKAAQLTASARPDRILIISGEATARFKEGALGVDAKAQVDRGLMVLKSERDSALDPDIIRPGTPTTPASEKTTRTPITVKADINLGDSFDIRHKTFQARAKGVLHSISEPGHSPQVFGSLTLSKGKLFAYGQQLTIAEGQVHFTGPIDDPALDITALRENLPSNTVYGSDFSVGVHITGTARKPQLRLTSTPTLTDRERLSWILFGQDLATTKDKSQLNILAVAASALVSELGDDSGGGLSNWVGLDELSVQQNTEDVTQGVVHLGKQLAPNFYLGFGKGYNGAADELKLNYQISRKFSVEIKGSRENTVDLFYTLSFD